MSRDKELKCCCSGLQLVVSPKDKGVTITVEAEDPETADKIKCMVRRCIEGPPKCRPSDASAGSCCE